MKPSDSRVLAIGSAPIAADQTQFTCLLPVYHGDDPDFFRQALRSVLANTLLPDRILICEDGELPEALNRVIAEHACDRIQRSPNSGPPGLHNNLNCALERVETPWVCRADADDLNRPTRFATQVAHLALHPELSALGADILEFSPTGRTRRKSMPATPEAALRWAAFRNPLNHMTVFARTDVLKACGGYPSIPLKEDYALWLQLLIRGHKLSNVPEVLVEARLGSGFYGRRSGLNNIQSELAIFGLKRQVREIGTLRAAAALAIRATVLSLGPVVTGTVYESVLR